MNAVVVDTNVLIAFLEKGSGVAELLERFDRLLVPAAVDAEFRAGLDMATKSGVKSARFLDDLLGDGAGRGIAQEYPRSRRTSHAAVVGCGAAVEGGLGMVLCGFGRMCP